MHGFPEKIVELNELLSTSMFSERNFSDVHQDLNIPVPEPIVVNNNINQMAIGDGGCSPPPKKSRYDSATVAAIAGNKVMCLPTGSVSCNGPLCEMIKVVKPIIRKLVEDCK